MSKKVKIAIAILFVILITYVVYSVINYKNTHVTQEDINRGIMEKGQLLLNGAGVFYEKYNGRLESKEIITHLSTVVKEYMPKLYKEIKNKDDNGLEKYYEKNKDEIQEQIGKKTAEDFIKFAKKIQNSNIDLKDYYTLDIHKESYKVEKNYVYIDASIQYNSGEELDVEFYIAINKGTRPNYIMNIK